MAGSRRSPVLSDDWRGANDTSNANDHSVRDNHGHHQSHQRPHETRRHRERGRDRNRERERRPRPKDGSLDRPGRSSPPPSRTFPHRGREGPPHKRRGGFPFSNNNNNHHHPTHARGSPGPFSEDYRGSGHRNPEQHRLPPWETDGATEREPRRDASPSTPPPSKRKRTRSPSPRRSHHQSSHPSQHGRHPRNQPKHGEGFGRGFSKRGRFAGRGRFGRGGRGGGEAPRRGRDWRRNESRRVNSSPGRDSVSPVRGRDSLSPPGGWSRSPRPDEQYDRDFRHRSTSRHSLRSVDSRYSTYSRRDSAGDMAMNSTRPQGRPPMDSAESHYSKSPQYMASNKSYDGSPRSASPYPSRSAQAPYQGQQRRSSPYQQNNYAPSDSYQGNQGSYNGPPDQSPYPGPSYRGGRSGYRDPYQYQHPDRRFHNGEPSSRGHFNNHQWTASTPRGHDSPPTGPRNSSRSPAPSANFNQQSPQFHEGAHPFRPVSGHHQMEESGSNPGLEQQSDAQKMPPPEWQPNNIPTGPSKGRISFAFKAKTTPTAVPKPVPDMAQRMQPRDPPPRVADPAPKNRTPLGPAARFKPDSRFDHRGRDRDRERDRDRGRPDRRDFKEGRGGGFRESRGGGRDKRRDDRRFDNNRQERRRGGDKRADFRHGRRRTRSPEWDREPELERELEAEPEREPRKTVKVVSRPKPRPTLPEEFTQSDSVYYRKPGNESVIGAGTYGKVFKAVHVYTQQGVALKKIRMEGEKDGFPVTAMREIKLLQHLRSHNVVSLLEVMVERNECFMVFEYLAHDLTGLINHPTFTLTEAHKKDLAKQMFEGLNYLHHRSVLHRDIKAANILISNTGLLKYADFGLARFFSKSRQLDYTNRVITIWYRPPELLLGETRYGPAVDVWSAACVYVEMFTKKAVFPGEGGEISQLDKLYNSLGTPTRAEWPDLAEMPWFELMRPTERKKRVFEEQYRSVLSPAALDLVSKIFQYDPAKRPTSEEVLAHPYFVSEEPKPHQAFELEQIEGDWHEFESKALRKERDREARRAEHQQKEKRKAVPSAPQSDRDSKRVKPDSGEQPQPEPAAE